MLALCVALPAAVTARPAKSKGKQYTYRSVEGDPMQSRIYTLDNGLTVYMTVYREKPRIQTYIAVRVGAKNDPLETTGMAHYFEHLMFKGSEQFGTSDYAAEKPLLDRIEQLFEEYRRTDDDAERRAIYRQIDSISNIASKIAIPNEYDKLMASIGASGSNAWTSQDETVYTEDIPSNQIENWAKIQSDRFKHAVVRGFHTELETIYEEYNMSLTNDGNKVYYKMLEMLYPHHPYGMHTVLGRPEHLKNPSITNVINYYRSYYVPNNMAICLSGDFDPDEMIRVIDRYFGDMKPAAEIPALSFQREEPILSPREATVYGNDAEFLSIAWPIDGSSSIGDSDMASLVASILSNGKCGLLDVDILQKQKMLDADAYDETNVDYGAMVLYGYPKEGQSLDEVRGLLLAEVDKLRRGEFDASLIGATIANYKRAYMSYYENNRMRAMLFKNSFIAGTDWQTQVELLDRMAKITKDDIVAWVGRKMPADGYAVIYKLQGEDTTQKKIDKPQITPIETNRDAVSQFLTDVQSSEVEPLEPQFVDFDRDMAVVPLAKGVQMLYKRNEINDLFQVQYRVDLGTRYDPFILPATEYMRLLGTDNKSLAEIQSRLYNMACTISVGATGSFMYLYVGGLQEHMDEALALAEEYILTLKGDDEILAEYKQDLFKARANAKLNQRANFNALTTYAMYGADGVRRMTLSDEQIAAMTSDDLVGRIRHMFDYEHEITYYGPASQQQVEAIIAKYHKMPADPIAVKPLEVRYAYALTPVNRVIVAPYDAKQIYYRQYANRGERFSTDNDAVIDLYNEYFSGNMNAIVFQEMREARSLAYSASAYLSEGTYADDPYYYVAFIATQNDKMPQAVEAFDQIINDMPVSQPAFDLAKQSLLQQLQAARTTGVGVINKYIDNRRKGLSEDRNIALYKALPDLTIDDIIAYQKAHVAGSTYTYLILGDPDDIDMDFLRSIAEVELVTTSDIFGY